MCVSNCHLKRRQASFILDILLQTHAIGNKFSSVFQTKTGERRGVLLFESYRAARQLFPGCFPRRTGVRRCRAFSVSTVGTSIARPRIPRPFSNVFKRHFENTTIFFVFRFAFFCCGVRGVEGAAPYNRVYYSLLPNAHCLVKRTASRWPSWQSGRAGASAGRRWPCS